MALIDPVFRSNIPIPPSCVAFSPLRPGLFVVGTYFLEKNDDAEEVKDDVGGTESVSLDAPRPQSRNGSLILCRVQGDNITELQTLSTPSALLDLVFLPWENHSHIFVTADSTGSLSFYELSKDASEPPISLIHTHQCTDPSILLTDLEAHPSIPGLLGYVTSSGLVSLLEIDLDILVKTNRSGSDFSKLVKNHQSFPCADEGFEAWTLAFANESHDQDQTGKSRSVGVYTGSDDSTLRRIDFDLKRDQSPRPVVPSSNNGDDDDDGQDTENENAVLRMLDRRSHNAGVVAILPLSLPQPTSDPAQDERVEQSSNDMNEIIMTGSYDDHIRVLSRPKTAASPLLRNKILAELNLGGGVWRLKIISQSTPALTSVSTLSSERSWTILASCMHAGSRIVRVTRSDKGGVPHVSSGEDGQGEWTFDVLARFEEHKSMNYGSDVQPRLGQNREAEGFQQGDERGETDNVAPTIISTSFYDRLMCLWRV